ncbi:sugar translocase [Sulfolobales archaeon HS-7]|nr:sugar translocase [Sulfolobales archaeon HS-7]
MKYQLLLRLIKFGVVGALGTVVNEGILYFLLKVSPLIIAVVVAIEASVIFNFFLNDIWTFNDKKVGSIVSRVIKFHGSSASGIAVQLIVFVLLIAIFFHIAELKLLLIYLLKEISGSSFSILEINFISIVAGFIIRFITSYWYVWA